MNRMAIAYPFPEPPAPGTVLSVARGILWLRMPLPFQLDHINLWLLQDGPGWTIVDTGLGLDDTRALWERLFRDCLDGRPVTRVVVTHFHPDHMGNAEWLTSRWQTELWSSEGEWRTASAVHQISEANFDARVARIRQHGADEDAIEKLKHRRGHYLKLVPTIPSTFRRLRDGDALTIDGQRWEVLTVQGHSPEHACLWSAEAGVLISGDQVLPKITTNVSVSPEQPSTNPLRLYLASLARFQPMAPDTLVLPSHGLPFQGLHERLAQLRQHHELRLSEILDALVEPQSVAELLPKVFRRALDAHQLGFAFGEALSHLHFLEAEGRVERVIGADGVHRFRKV